MTLTLYRSSDALTGRKTPSYSHFERTLLFKTTTTNKQKACLSVTKSVGLNVQSTGTPVILPVRLQTFLLLADDHFCGCLSRFDTSDCLSIIAY